MGLFKQIAEPMALRNVPVIPLRPKTKIAFLSNWDSLATTSLDQIQKWDEEYPDANAAAVAFAKPGGVWFLEMDRVGLLDEIEKQAGQKIPPTLTVRSSKGRGHLYFRQTPASMAMGNVQKSDEKGEIFSARVNARYIVAPFSWHPTSNKQYELLRDIDPIEAPDWLVAWCTSQSTEKVIKTGNPEIDDITPIAEGSRNNALTSILGKARQVLAIDKEQLYQLGLSINQRRCVPPLSDIEVRTIAYSVGRYEVKQAAPVIMGGVPLGQPQVVEPIVPVYIKPMPYPVFPRWVMKGTSLYTGLIEPVCAKNSRYPEFMFRPMLTI